MIEQPLTLPCGATLPNRLAKAAMSEALADVDGLPTLRHERLYRRWAEGGSGLLITGNVMIDARSLERPGNVIVEDERAMKPLTAWANAARSCGRHAIVQLSHPGRQVQRTINSEPVAPSAVQAVQVMKSFARPRALTGAEIRDLQRRFVDAAVLCRRAGFSGVQLHAAHGYLLNQFLSPLTNLRTDEWGGSLENRARLLLDTVAAVREATGPSFLISVKLNSADFQRGGFAEDDSLKVVAMLEQAGIDLLEISGGNYEAPEMFRTGQPDPRRASTVAREAYFLAFAERVRTVAKLPLMVTGGFRSRAAMEAALAAGHLDLVGLGRPLALEPDFAQRLIDGTTERSPVTPKRFFLRQLDMLADGAWSWHQIRRIADGKQPEPALSTWRAVLAFVLQDLTLASRRRRQPLLAAPAPPTSTDQGH